MRIEEAIEILSNPSLRLRRNAAIDYLDAAKLGIEALKRVQHDRIVNDDLNPYPLPGETTEAET